MDKNENEKKVLKMVEDKNKTASFPINDTELQMLYQFLNGINFTRRESQACVFIDNFCKKIEGYFKVKKEV